MTTERRDDLDHPVPLHGTPRRVVSLVPSLTEALADTGTVVGATDYCTHPATLDVSRVGGSKYPEIARVLDIAPDLVIANAEENRESDVQTLRDNGIPVWVTAAAGTVPIAIGSLRRLFIEIFDAEPEWLRAAARVWATVDNPTRSALVPVWRKPWVVLGRDTFAGDMLLRLGIRNVYGSDEQRYPRPGHAELLQQSADLVVLPDEPYEFSATDGPEYFPALPFALVSGRHLTWYGPSLVEAREILQEQLSSTS